MEIPKKVPPARVKPPSPSRPSEPFRHSAPPADFPSLFWWIRGIMGYKMGQTLKKRTRDLNQFLILTWINHPIIGVILTHAQLG